MIIVGYKKSSDAKLAFKQLQKRLVGEEGRLINWIPLHFEKKKNFLQNVMISILKQT